MLHRSLALAAVACLLRASPLMAASMYEFGFDSSTYEVKPGATFTVSVYLYETITAGNYSVLANDQIANAGVRVSYDASSTATDPVSLASEANAIQAAPAFTDETDDRFPTDFVTVYSTPAEFAAGGTGAANPIAGLDVSSFTPIPGTVVAGSGGQKYAVEIGSIKMTAGDILGETTVIKASDLFTNSVNTYTNAPWVGLDESPLTIYATTAQITVVPEPSAWIGLSSMTLMAGIFWKIRSRRRKQ
jgi:hypothetical protein